MFPMKNNNPHLEPWDHPETETLPTEDSPALTADFNTAQAERLGPGCFRVLAVPIDCYDR
jgi:hypothetical protein